MAGVNNQNTQQPRKNPVTIGGYPKALHDLMSAKYPDYDKVMQGASQGGIPAVAHQPMNMNVFQQNGGASGKFEADPKQREVGFVSWLGTIMPKSRPGMREGETPDEYDRRITTNRERIAAFADAIRHMANIVNTSKGAPLQVFNDPTTMMEQGYQNRKAQRQKQAAIDADAAYKQANLDLDKRKAQADQIYKEYLMGLRGEGNQLAKDKFEYRKGKDAAAAQRQAEQDKLKQNNWERMFKFREQQSAISNGLRQQSINKRGSGRSSGGKSGGGSSNGYPLYNPVTGKTEYLKNEKSWIARAAELGYDTTKGNSSSTTTDTGLKKETTNRSGASVATKIGLQTAQKKAAAKGKGKTGIAKPAGKLGGKKYH